MKKSKLADTQNENSNLIFLDDLIGTYYKKIKEQVEDEKTLKLGDFLKMVELRNKLAPDKNSQKKLWDMLENIRKQASESNPKKIKKQKSKTTNKTKQK